MLRCIKEMFEEDVSFKHIKHMLLKAVITIVQKYALFFSILCVIKKVSEYDQEIQQSLTADKPKAL